MTFDKTLIVSQFCFFRESVVVLLARRMPERKWIQSVLHSEKKSQVFDVVHLGFK